MRIVQYPALVAVLFANAILADPTSVSCTQGQDGQKPVANADAQVAMQTFLSAMGCHPGMGQKLITIGLGGKIIHVANGVTAQLTTPRAVDSQIPCSELSSSFSAVVQNCATNPGFGGVADNWGIWAAEIGTQPGIGIQAVGRREEPPVPTTMVTVAKRATNVESAIVTVAPHRPSPVLRKRDVTTVVEVSPGVTETFELSSPTGVPSINIAVDSLVNNVGDAFNDLHSWGGFGNGDVAYSLRKNLQDTNNAVVGSVEMDVTFNASLGEDQAFSSLEALRDLLKAQWNQAPFAQWTWRMVGPGNQLQASGNFNLVNQAAF
ncbi:hypothetical protein BGZ63DRAFT_424890 [Mariannaea sp. PMI_226]|nr:hypothetical protein BGZ63DRAFT_424890 [Mariannaea sp. PMI_226]